VTVALIEGPIVVGHPALARGTNRWGPGQYRRHLCPELAVPPVRVGRLSRQPEREEGFLGHGHRPDCTLLVPSYFMPEAPQEVLA
jgi:hypothetical protein